VTVEPSLSAAAPRRRRVILLGDSHTRAMEAAALLPPLAPFHIRCRRVPGATAIGMRNPNSMTDALGIFQRALDKRGPEVAIVVQIGEVDCGFVIWYRAAKYGVSVEAELEASVAALFGFVDANRAAGRSRWVVTGAVPPTIGDGQSWGEVANARREVTASLAERTELTLRYNAMLAAAAAARGIAYVEITRDVLDPATGVVDPAFLNPDPTDHHLHPEKAARLWADRLAPVLATLV